MEASEIRDKISDHDKRIALLAQKQEEHRNTLKDHAGVLAELRASEIAIRERLGMAATHDDIQELHNKFDAYLGDLKSDINELLKPALNSVPEHASLSTARQTLVWTIVASVAALVMLFLSVHGK